MKFEVNSITFFKFVNQINKARNKNNINLNLSNLYFEVNNNTLIGRATNLEISCETTIIVKGLINGNCLINGEIITKIVNSFNSLDININCEIIDNILNLNYQKNKIQIKTTNFEEFPIINKTGDIIASIKLKTFINLIKSVSFSVASTEIKPEISSIYIYSQNNNLYAVATDSFRLSEKKIDFKLNENSDLNILISQKCIKEALSILDQLNENENVNIYKNKNSLTFKVLETNITINSVNGNFPDYKQLFPNEFVTKIKTNKEELKNILNLSTVFINNYSYIEMDLNIENKTLKIKSKNDLIGSIEKEINIYSISGGENILVSYNSNYFLEGLAHIEGDEIELSFINNTRPMFIKNPKDLSFVYLLMPINR